MAADHLDKIYDSITDFLQEAVTHLKIENHVLEEIGEGMNAKLHDSKRRAEEELGKLCRDEQEQPITYNHYYTDNVQKSRVDYLREAVDQTKFATNSETFSQGSNVAVATFSAALQKRLIVDMDEQACSEALAGLNAYYKVSL